MRSNKIRAFLNKDIKLIDIKRLILFSSLGIFFYIMIGAIGQYDNQGNMYLFGVGYQPIELIQNSLISAASAFVFIAGTTVIEFNENQALGFSYIAAKVKVKYMIIARTLFCLGCMVIAEIIILVYFTGLLGFSAALVFGLSCNAMFSTLLLYLTLVFLFSKKKVDIVGGCGTVVITMYGPIFLTINQMIIVNVIFSIIYIFWIMKFCENNYRNKLQEESGKQSIRISQIELANNEVNRIIKNFANQVYDAVANAMNPKINQELSIIFLDIQRNSQVIKKIGALFIFGALFGQDILVKSLVIILCVRELLSQTISNYEEDSWIYCQGLMTSSKFWRCKTITAIVFNTVILCMINLLLFGLSAQSLIQGLSSALLLVISSIGFSRMILINKHKKLNQKNKR